MFTGDDNMENMPRERIAELATNILSSGDIVAKHGTSIENALSIINTGFNYQRTSFVIQTSKSIEALCGYGWKENGPNDSANVIIEVPREFIMDLLSINNDGYQKWLQNIIDGNNQEAVINSITTYEMQHIQNSSTNSLFSPPMPPIMSAHIPQEFIVGAFIWCNGKTYLRLDEGESALDNLTFIPNDNFYLNMQADAKKEFIRKMRTKIGIADDEKKLR